MSVCIRVFLFQSWLCMDPFAPVLPGEIDWGAYADAPDGADAVDPGSVFTL